MKYTFILFIFLFSSCSFLRKVRKQQNKTDSTSTKQLDSTAVKNIFEQLQNGKGESTVTTFLPGRDTFIYVNQPNGEVKIVPYQIPPQIIKIETERWEAQNKINQTYDSTNKAKDEETRLSLGQKAKTVEERAGLDWKFLLLLGIVVILAGAVAVLYLKKR